MTLLPCPEHSRARVPKKHLFPLVSVASCDDTRSSLSLFPYTSQPKNLFPSLHIDISSLHNLPHQVNSPSTLRLRAITQRSSCSRKQCPTQTTKTAYPATKTGSRTGGSLWRTTSTRNGYLSPPCPTPFLHPPYHTFPSPHLSKSLNSRTIPHPDLN